MMKKKIVSIFMSFVMLFALSLVTGCGGGGGGTSGTSGSVSGSAN